MNDLQYSYSSKPRAVLSNRAKAMRDPALLLPTNNEPRQLGPNIMYDPRIVRGSVFAPNASSFTQKLHSRPFIAQQAPTPTRRSSDKKSSKRSGASGPRKKSQNIYEAQQVASYSFTPFSLDANLIEQPPLKHDRDGATQTDAFKEITVRTPKRAMADGVYQRPKVGIDSGTQIEVSDKLFNFDVEVKPLVNVLVSKTIAQALAEVKEEEEMKAIKRERVLLDEEKETQRKADRALEQKAREAVQKKAKTMQFQAQKLEERKRFNEKLLAWQLAHKMFPRVLSTAQATLYKKGVFYDPTQRELQQWLLTDVYVSADTKLRLRELSHRLLDVHGPMSIVQVNMGASGNAILENYTLGDVFICKAHRGKLQEVISLLDEVHADVNYSNQNGCTALHGAAASGQLEVVQWLLEYPGITTTLVDDEEQSPLHYAAFYGHLEVVQLLVEHGVPLDVPDKYGRLAHCSAAINGHLDVVTYLLEECPNPIDINSIDEYGGTCLHWAASKGRKEVVQYLCMKGIDVHVTSYDNKTAYQLAKDKHKHKCVQFLKNWYETSQKFVHAAEDGDNDEIARIITEINGSFPLRYMRDKNGKNAMHWAAESGHLSTLKLLGEHFAVWTDADKFGRNALHCAALGGHKDCAFWLVRKARDASQFLSLTMTNKSPSRCAFEAGHSTLAARLQAWEEGNDEYSTNDDEAQTEAGSSRSTIDDDEQPTKSTTRARDIDNVHNWLKSLNMDEYTKHFEKDGFDTLRGVATIEEDDLIDMRVKKGHRRVVLSHIEELRSQLAQMDENSVNAGREPDSSPTLDMLPPLNKSLSSVATEAPQPAPAAAASESASSAEAAPSASDSLASPAEA
ncbi:TPA: hypothetical protein N0F65_001283 [Lagenidium giganteum]|uniref:SAM domain-containing protein n=1 Tax=Lagenidium giganteum TaxID=4803 RepID=A0AAV2Z229_9STRA|nr:TPA: hypothetical protein N0F65_001283 [Lagenidium giganteum]